MILVSLGAQKSPPKTYFFVKVFLKITYWSKLKTFICQMFYNEFTSPCTKTTLRKTIKKQIKSKRPFTSLKIAQAPKTKIFVMYLPPKGNDWTPPRDPPRSPQNVPKPTRGAPETPQSSPRAPQDPQDAKGATKPCGNQQTRKQNNINIFKNHRK